MSSVQNRLNQDAKQREIDLLRKELERMKDLEYELTTLRMVLEDIQKKRKKKRSRKNKRKEDEAQSSETEEDTDQLYQKRKNDEPNSGTSSPPYKNSWAEQWDLEMKYNTFLTENYLMNRWKKVITIIRPGSKKLLQELGLVNHPATLNNGPTRHKPKQR